jgi:hypothetical protein
VTGVAAANVTTLLRIIADLLRASAAKFASTVRA